MYLLSLVTYLLLLVVSYHGAPVKCRCPFAVADQPLLRIPFLLLAACCRWLIIVAL